MIKSSGARYVWNNGVESCKKLRADGGWVKSIEQNIHMESTHAMA
tara:strand:+ start:152 stop:286 length:135 start_codon:yes stop_codon:yes gene_type:complete